MGCLGAEIGDMYGLRVEHLGHRAFEDEFSEIKNEDVGANLADQCHVVLDKKDAKSRAC
jgi:hypothetical protein